MTTCHCFFFIDACGAEVIRPFTSFTDLAPRWKPLRSVFGYSSACVPSILAGTYPEDHLHWSFFCRIPGQTLKVPKWLSWIPPQLRDRGRVRSKLSGPIATANNITGYFQVYQMPFAHLHEYSHCEPRDIFKPGGLNAGTTFVDDLNQADPRTWWVADWHDDTQDNWATMRDKASQPLTQFLFMYDAHLDAWLHDHTRQDQGLEERLRHIRNNIESVLKAAQAQHDTVIFHVFSDHGMCTITKHVDMLKVLNRASARMHHDYHCVIDSTMVRCWYHNENAANEIRSLLAQESTLTQLSKEQLATWKCNFPDDRFGQDIWLADPGVLLVPSHMGTSPLAGMHGYSIEHEDSDASYLTNHPTSDPHDIVAVNALMREAARELPRRPHV